MEFFNNLSELEGFIGRMIDKLDASRTDTVELAVGEVSLRLSKGALHRPPHGEGHCPPPVPQHTPAAPVAPVPAAPAAPSAEPVPAPAVQEAPANLRTINAPLLGVAYAAPSPDAAPFVSVGQMVKKGDIICIIEAMKVMNEIEADQDGEVAEILFTNGKMVEFGQPLIAVK
ncbi:MAG: acetyl-CoA carboxylase biotin carboxyl carrier protein [Clostridia bacterium]|nr:acetyl-CoA carboxylase biotin carboxyl carrier protein [Clostridia bacterium]